MKESGRRKLLGIGVVGSVIAALCCFTPVLLIVFGSAGVLAVAGWLDPVLMLALTGFVGLTLFAIVRRNKAAKNDRPA
ncbi:MAG: mercury resistance system transport protein MerF [Alphaproteobacteria bacterium]|nr:mercury resistance system transport protein MerF [Alphaproteobacteria bacterium]